MSLSKIGLCEQNLTPFEGRVKRGRVEQSRHLSGWGGEHITARLKVKIYLKYRPETNGTHRCLQRQRPRCDPGLGPEAKMPMWENMEKDWEKNATKDFFTLYYYYSLNHFIKAYLTCRQLYIFNIHNLMSLGWIYTCETPTTIRATNIPIPPPPPPKFPPTSFYFHFCCNFSYVR